MIYTKGVDITYINHAHFCDDRRVQNRKKLRILYTCNVGDHNTRSEITASSRSPPHPRVSSPIFHPTRRGKPSQHCYSSARARVMPGYGEVWGRFSSAGWRISTPLAPKLLGGEIDFQQSRLHQWHQSNERHARCVAVERRLGARSLTIRGR